MGAFAVLALAVAQPGLCAPPGTQAVPDSRDAAKESKSAGSGTRLSWPDFSFDVFGLWSLPEKTFRARAVDADSRQPLTSAFFLASEYTMVTYSSFADSQSDAFCFRSDAAIADGTPEAAITLPRLGAEPTSRINKSTTYVEFDGYAPGYCATSPSGPGHWGAYLKLAARDASPLDQRPLPEPRSGDVVSFSFKRSADAGEYRLHYLLQLARGFAQKCRMENWGSGGLAAKKRLTDAIVGEAEGLAKSPVERYLAQSVRRSFEPSAPLSPMDSTVYIGEPWNLVTMMTGGVDVDAVKAVRFPGRPTAADLRRKIEQRGRGEVQQAIYAEGSKYAVYCRGGDLSTCNFNERNFAGQTHLMRAAMELNADKVAMLLALGTDPNIENMPGGDTALDLVISQIEKFSASTRSDLATKAILVLDTLTRDGKATIKASTLDRISETWAGKGNPPLCSPEWIRPRQAGPFCGEFMPIARRLRALPARREFHADCPMS
jgi:hypothetical protein